MTEATDLCLLLRSELENELILGATTKPIGIIA